MHVLPGGVVIAAAAAAAAATVTADRERLLGGDGAEPTGAAALGDGCVLGGWLAGCCRRRCCVACLPACVCVCVCLCECVNACVGRPLPCAHRSAQVQVRVVASQSCSSCDGCCVCCVCSLVRSRLACSPMNGDDYPPYNRPFSIQHWLEHSERPIAESTIIILDPDQMFLVCMCVRVCVCMLAFLRCIVVSELLDASSRRRWRSTAARSTRRR